MTLSVLKRSVLVKDGVFLRLCQVVFGLQVFNIIIGDINVETITWFIDLVIDRIADYFGNRLIILVIF